MTTLIDENFEIFYEKVKISLTDGTFAKLTMAKTIGKTDLNHPLHILSADDMMTLM